MAQRRDTREYGFDRQNDLGMTEVTALVDLGISDFVDLALSRIPSTFGKLAFLASLTDEHTGRYGDSLAVLLYGREQTEACLKQKHRETFFAWLRLALAAQTADLTKCWQVRITIKIRFARAGLTRNCLKS